jgi:hypothetical protein
MLQLGDRGFLHEIPAGRYPSVAGFVERHPERVCDRVTPGRICTILLSTSFATHKLCAHDAGAPAAIHSDMPTGLRLVVIIEAPPPLRKSRCGPASSRAPLEFHFRSRTKTSPFPLVTSARRAHECDQTPVRGHRNRLRIAMAAIGAGLVDTHQRGGRRGWLRRQKRRGLPPGFPGGRP